MNGYPLDYSGFNRDADGNQILSDDAFRVVTQEAIWYYTDQIKWLDSNPYRPTEQEEEIYNKLINNLLSNTEINQIGGAVDLYLCSNSSYQNLLAVNASKVNILELTKQTVNGDENDAFTFEITIKTGDGKKYWVDDQTSTGAVVKDDQNGTITATLKAGEKISISSFSTNFSYTIKEVEKTYASGLTYTPSIAVTAGSGTVDPTDSSKISGTNVTQHTGIVYTNTSNAKQGTGDLTIEKTMDADTISNVPENVYADEAFAFTLVLTDGTGQPYNGPTADTNDPDQDADTIGKIFYETSGGTTKYWDNISDGTVQFQLKHGESITVKNLPAGTSYQVTENTDSLPDGFSLSSSTNTKGVIKKDSTIVSGFVNTYDNRLNIGGNYRLEGWKSWDHTDNVSTVPTSVILEIYKRVNGVDTKLYDLTLPANGLADPFYYTASWPLYENGYEVQYYVKEINVPEGYTCTVTDLDTFKALVGGDVPAQVAGMSIINTFNANLLSDLVIQKEVTDQTKQNVKFSITLSDTAYTGEATVTDGNGTQTVTFPGGADNTIEVTMLSDGSITVPKLFSGTTYTVQEVDIPDGYQLNGVAGTQAKKDGTQTTLADLTTPDADTPQKVQGTVPNTPNDPYTITLTFTNESLQAPDPTDPTTHSFAFSKQDVAGNELAGATIELRDNTDAVVETWVSDGTVHTFTVEPGTYTLVETAAPQGYLIATAITVTVGVDGSIEKDDVLVTGNAPVVMVDEAAPIPEAPPTTHSFAFSKQDVAGKELAGATIELRDDTDAVVETWVSDGTVHTFTVEPGTYTLVETAAPQGYLIATAITVTVGVDGSIEKDDVLVTGNAPVVMVDEAATQVTTTPSTGNTETTTDASTGTGAGTSTNTTAPDTGTATQVLPTSPKTGGTQSVLVWCVPLLLAFIAGALALSYSKLKEFE